MTSRPVVVDWREVGALDFRWRDAFDNAIEQLSSRWELEYAQPSSMETDILLLAYPAAQHSELTDEGGSLKKIGNHPGLSTSGQLVVLACGQASPHVSEQDVLQFSRSRAVTDATSCDNVRAMRVFSIDEALLIDTLSRRLAVLQHQGIAVQAPDPTLIDLSLAFTTTEHLDY